MKELKIKIPRRDEGKVLHAIFTCNAEDGQQANDLIESKTPKKNPLIIMIHGFTGDKSEWGRFDEAAKRLCQIKSDDYPWCVLRFDIVGSGENEREPILLSKGIENLEDVYNWAKDHGFTNIATIGLSFGGLISLMADLPGRKAAVFWAPGFFLKKAMGFTQKLLATILAIFAPRKEVRIDSSNPDYAPIIINSYFFREISTKEAEKRLRAFNTPSLVVQGTKDDIVKSENNYYAFSLMPHDENHKLVKVEGANHDFKDKHLEIFIDATIDFLKKYI
ncbi:MAG: alpha/beta hydrolase family protein [Promethearchaeota archaeon]